jgi:hypothetical protein
MAFAASEFTNNPGYSVVDFNWYIIPEQLRKLESAKLGYPGSAEISTAPSTETADGPGLGTLSKPR